MIKKSDIKCELFDSVEIKDYWIDFKISKEVITVFLNNEEHCHIGIVGIGSHLFDTEQFDEIIRVRQLLKESTK